MASDTGGPAVQLWLLARYQAVLLWCHLRQLYMLTSSKEAVDSDAVNQMTSLSGTGCSGTCSVC